MKPHSRLRRFTGAFLVLVFVHGLYQYVYGVLLPS